MLKYASRGIDGVEGMLTDGGYEVDAEMARSISKSKIQSEVPQRKQLPPLTKLYEADIVIEDTLPGSSALKISKSTLLKESDEPVFHQGGPVDHTNINDSNYKTSFTNRESGVDYKTRAI